MDESQAPGTDDWLSAQQKYWDAWLELTRQTAGGNGGGPKPEALENWWDAVSGIAPPPTRELFARLVDLSRPFMEMAEKFATDSTQDAHAVLERWLAGMTQAFSAPSAAADAAGRAGRTAAASFAPPRRGVASLAPTADDFWQAAKTDTLARMSGKWREYVDRWSAVPAVGYTRETQEQYQRLVRLQMEYLEAWHVYHAGFGRVARRATDKFRARVEQTAPAPDTLRRLYDLWIDACEEAYAEYALSEDHGFCYARLVNALAALKQQSSLLLDDALEGLNLPTRREIDAMHRHVQQTRRAHQALSAELEQFRHRAGQEAVARAPRARRKTKHH